MSWFSKLFGGDSSSASKGRQKYEGLEDVRKGGRGEGEVILNLWYELDGHIISGLRCKRYIASGTDDQKLRFLQQRANTDFSDASTHAVPESMKTDVKLVGEYGSTDAGKECTLEMLDFLGGYMGLFRDIIRSTDPHGFTFDTSNAMMCVTGLVRENGELRVQIDRIDSL